MKNKIILFLTGILLLSSCKNNVKADYSKGLRLNIQIGGEVPYYSARSAFIPSSSSAVTFPGMASSPPATAPDDPVHKSDAPPPRCDAPATSI